MDDMEEEPSQQTAWYREGIRGTSFAEVLQGRNTSLPIYTGEGKEDVLDEMSLTDILQNQDMVEEGALCLVVNLSWDLTRQPWRRALVIKILGKILSFRVLELMIKKVWQLELGCKLIDIDKGFIVACFFSRKVYVKFLIGGPWTVLRHYLTITKWKPNFKTTDMAVHSTLAWVCFPTLPLELFDDKNLIEIANGVGKTIRMASNLGSTMKGKYVRVCMELDLSTPLVPNVLVWGRKQPVEYERLPKICFRCGKHSQKKIELCGTKMEGNQMDTSYGIEGHTKKMGSTSANPYGMWMLPAYERHRLQMMQKG